MASWTAWAISGANAGQIWGANSHVPHQTHKGREGANSGMASGEDDIYLKASCVEESQLRYEGQPPQGHEGIAVWRDTQSLSESLGGYSHGNMQPRSAMPASEISPWTPSAEGTFRASPRSGATPRQRSASPRQQGEESNPQIPLHHRWHEPTARGALQEVSPWTQSNSFAQSGLSTPCSHGPPASLAEAALSRLAWLQAERGAIEAWLGSQAKLPQHTQEVSTFGKDLLLSQQETSAEERRVWSERHKELEERARFLAESLARAEARLKEEEEAVAVERRRNAEQLLMVRARASPRGVSAPVSPLASSSPCNGARSGPILGPAFLQERYQQLATERATAQARLENDIKALADDRWSAPGSLAAANAAVKAMARESESEVGVRSSMASLDGRNTRWSAPSSLAAASAVSALKQDQHVELAADMRGFEASVAGRGMTRLSNPDPLAALRATAAAVAQEFEPEQSTRSKASPARQGEPRWSAPGSVAALRPTAAIMATEVQESTRSKASPARQGEPRWSAPGSLAALRPTAAIMASEVQESTRSKASPARQGEPRWSAPGSVAALRPTAAIMASEVQVKEEQRQTRIRAMTQPDNASARSSSSGSHESPEEAARRMQAVERDLQDLAKRLKMPSRASQGLEKVRSARESEPVDLLGLASQAKTKNAAVDLFELERRASEEARFDLETE